MSQLPFDINGNVARETLTYMTHFLIRVFKLI